MAWGWRLSSVTFRTPVLSQNDSTYHHSVFTTWKWHPFATWTPSFIILVWGHHSPPRCAVPYLPASRTVTTYNSCISCRSAICFTLRYDSINSNLMNYSWTNGRLAIPALAGLLVLCCCVCSLFYVLFILMAVASDSCWCHSCVRLRRALNFVHYVRCVKIFYARRLHTLRELLQKPPYVVVVVEFCVYLIHLSLWYCKSRQRFFVRFLVLCFSWSQKVALCFIVLLFSLCGDIAAGRPNCEVWPRLVTVQWSELWHVNSLQTLCWEIGDKSRSWNNNSYKYYTNKLDAGMWRYHANRMDARRSQFDLGRVDAYI